jgi:hypothetical protein
LDDAAGSPCSLAFLSLDESASALSSLGDATGEWVAAKLLLAEPVKIPNRRWAVTHRSRSAVTHHHISALTRRYESEPREPWPQNSSP